MEKTEMMKQKDFERLSSLMTDKGVAHEAFELLADLRSSERVFASKAAAYDRLMSGNATMKELANITSHPVAIDSDGNLFMYYNTPSIGVDSDGDGGWWDVLRKPVKLPRWFASYDGNWEDSLTMPDGWEEK